MPRIRTIKPEFPQSESMGRVSRDARLCFILLWTLADDSGRLRGDSRMLASLLFPYDEDSRVHIDSWLLELWREGCITRYKVSNDSYVQVNQWGLHQKIDRPSASKIPPPPDPAPLPPERRANPRDGLAKAREDSSLDQGPRTKDQGGEGTSAEPKVFAPPVIVLPAIDDGDGFPIDNEMLGEWSSAYPAVSVMQKLREMRQWLLSNPKKGKTMRGMRRFVTSWLAEQQNRARPAMQTVRERDEQRARERAAQWGVPDVTPRGDVIDMEEFVGRKEITG